MAIADGEGDKWVLWYPHSAIAETSDFTQAARTVNCDRNRRFLCRAAQ